MQTITDLTINSSSDKIELRYVPMQDVITFTNRGGRGTGEEKWPGEGDLPRAAMDRDSEALTWVT